jgi:hypothetical protein
MTWVNTPPKEKVEGEEAEGDDVVDDDDDDDEPIVDADGDEDEENKPVKKKYDFFKESDYNQRTPHERFFKDKNLETLAMSAPKT